MSDVALLAAKAWLFDAVCECGHLDIEHHEAPQAVGRRCAEGECDCYAWRPVTFSVKRTGVQTLPRQRHYTRSPADPPPTAHYAKRT